MELITPEIRDQLLENQGKPDALVKPVLKLFTPDANATWLIASFDPDDPDILYGLCDLGLGFPEVGYVSLAEIQSVRGRLKLPVERDLYWIPKGTLQEYASAALHAERIVEL